MAHRDPRDVPVETVRSLSVSQYVGTPPKARINLSRNEIAVGNVLSHAAYTTRNLDQASQAQNRYVCRPAILGPWPQSHWAHIPGSTTHGR